MKLIISDHLWWSPDGYLTISKVIQKVYHLIRHIFFSDDLNRHISSIQHTKMALQRPPKGNNGGHHSRIPYSNSGNKSFQTKKLPDHPKELCTREEGCKQEEQQVSKKLNISTCLEADNIKNHWKMWKSISSDRCVIYIVKHGLKVDFLPENGNVLVMPYQNEKKEIKRKNQQTFEDRSHDWT